jgi:membrane protein implicated in regulation of membrane protease activity
MWVVAEVLLGAMVLLAVLGLHFGPHSHLASAAFGALAAIWLLVMVATTQAGPLVFTLLGVDAFASTVLFVSARSIRHLPSAGRRTSLEGRDGVAVSDLSPDGIVRVGGEDWSAHAVNGTVSAGDPVSVVEATGVRLKVWGTHVPEIEGPLPGSDEKRTGSPWS